MHQLKEKVEERIGKLRNVIQEKEEALADVPQGTIHVCSYNNRTQFYLKDNSKRRYMKESERHIVEKLCQKDYDQRVVLAAQKELKQLEKLHKIYSETSCDSVYENLNAERKKLVQPIWLPNEEYIKNWEQVTYEKKGFHDDAPEFYTDKGERVRSKTEILIANALYKHGVPYHYEYPIYLKGLGKIHPDFTALNVKLRKEFYWEHMGLLDEEGYREYALERIVAYEKNGIFPGDGLILTHETGKNPVNSRMIEKVILEYLK